MYKFDKDKLPKGLSYPLKRSELDLALEQAGIRELFTVGFHTGNRKTNIILHVSFHGEKRHYHPTVAGTSSIVLYAVPSDTRALAHDLLIAQGLPKICSWLYSASRKGNVWRCKDHELILGISAAMMLEVKES